MPNRVESSCGVDIWEHGLRGALVRRAAGDHDRYPDGPGLLLTPVPEVISPPSLRAF